MKKIEITIEQVINTIPSASLAREVSLNVLTDEVLMLIEEIKEMILLTACESNRTMSIQRNNFNRAEWIKISDIFKASGYSVNLIDCGGLVISW